MSNMVFIIGRGRSGTTLLAKMLNQHSRLFVPPEGLFVINLKAKYANLNFSSEGDYKSFVADLFLDVRMSRWFSDPSQIIDALIEEQPSTYTEVCKLIYKVSAKSWSDKSNLAYFIDKNPHYTLCVDELRVLFPGAKFVCLTRHFKSNIQSYLKVPFDLSNAPGLAARWIDFNKEVLHLLKDEPNRSLQIKMEDLVKNPKSEIEKLCEFLSIQYEEEMQSPKLLEGEVELDWHTGLSKSIDTSKAKSEPGSLEAEEYCNKKCESLAIDLGYTQVGKTSSTGLKGQLQFWIGQQLTNLEKGLDTVPFKWRLIIKNKYLFRINAFKEGELQKIRDFRDASKI